MYLTHKTIEEITEALLKESKQYSDLHFSTVLFKEMVSTDSGTVVRLSYEEDRWVGSGWCSESKRCKITHWLVMQAGVCTSVQNQYKFAKRRIGITVAPRRTEKIIRCKDAYEFDQQVCIDAKASGDDGYCGIRAYANITHTPYAESKKLCAEYGWTNAGMYTHKLLKLLKDQGYIVEDKTEYIREHAKTIKSFEKIGFRETYLIHVSSHFVSSVGGTITDYTHGSKKIIKHAYRITKS